MKEPLQESRVDIKSTWYIKIKSRVRKSLEICKERWKLKFFTAIVILYLNISLRSSSFVFCCPEKARHLTGAVNFYFQLYFSPFSCFLTLPLPSSVSKNIGRTGIWMSRHFKFLTVLCFPRLLRNYRADSLKDDWSLPRRSKPVLFLTKEIWVWPVSSSATLTNSQSLSCMGGRF